MSLTRSLDNLDQESWNRLQDVLERFEKDCILRFPREIRDYLPSLGDPLRRHLLLELVRTDLELRWRRRQPVMVDYYLTRYPELRSIDCIPALLQDEYSARKNFGESVEIGSYKSRFPKEFARLLNLLSDLEQPRPPSADAQDRSVVPEDLDMIATQIAKPGGLPSTRAEDIAVTVSAGGGDDAGERFRLIRKIGAGGFGEVWEAEGPGGVPVAVKRIFGSISPRAIEREKGSLDLICSGKLRHPFLLQVFGWWIEDEKLHIVMELADGSLDERLKAARLEGFPGVPPEELRQLMVDAASVLDFLNHEKNILHRDIKPANMLLMAHRLKLCDFGLARMSESLAIISGHTRGAGTPVFIAPEIIQGYQSPHSDQYSLAATYYVLRTGQPIFRGNAKELRQQHLTAIPALDDPNLTSVERKALLRALSKAPEDRYANNTQFVASLMSSLEHDGRQRGGKHVTTLDQANFEALPVHELRDFTPDGGSGPRGKTPQPAPSGGTRIMVSSVPNVVDGAAEQTLDSSAEQVTGVGETDVPDALPAFDRHPGTIAPDAPFGAEALRKSPRSGANPARPPSSQPTPTGRQAWQPLKRSGTHARATIPEPTSQGAPTDTRSPVALFAALAALALVIGLLVFLFRL